VTKDTDEVGALDAGAAVKSVALIDAALGTTEVELELVLSSTESMAPAAETVTVRFWSVEQGLRIVTGLELFS